MCVCVNFTEKKGVGALRYHRRRVQSLFDRLGDAGQKPRYKCNAVTA